MTAEEHVRHVEEAGRGFIRAMEEAAAAGVSDALLYPAVIGVLREGGMLPDIDFGSLLGMLR